MKRLMFTITGWYSADPEHYDSPDVAAMAKQDERSLNEGEWGLADLLDSATEITSVVIDPADPLIASPLPAREENKR